ncbi:MAG TPA: imidazolonepropionase, partial [Peptococcaceae bacterium]|nr:imidazolonepropionase [Peptococcaceae bacterium]
VISDQGIEMLAASDTVAVLLPATTFCVMGEQYAPARKMIEKGA